MWDTLVCSAADAANPDLMCLLLNQIFESERGFPHKHECVKATAFSVLSFSLRPPSQRRIAAREAVGREKAGARGTAREVEKMSRYVWILAHIADREIIGLMKISMSNDERIRRSSFSRYTKRSF